MNFQITLPLTLIFIALAFMWLYHHEETLDREQKQCFEFISQLGKVSGSPEPNTQIRVLQQLYKIENLSGRYCNYIPDALLADEKPNLFDEFLKGE